MPKYGWTPDGLRRMDSEMQAGEKNVTEPAGPDAAGGGETHYRCVAPSIQDSNEPCGRVFRIPAIHARHFNATHEDLREDSDSWREYYEEVTPDGDDS